MIFGTPPAALAVLLAGAALTATAAAEDLEGLPPGEGQEDVYYACSACHSIMLVTQQGMSRSRWDKTLVWMVEEQGMPAYPAGERDLILDYLATHFGERGTTRSPGALAGPTPSGAVTGSPAPDAAGFKPPSPFNTGQ